MSSANEVETRVTDTVQSIPKQYVVASTQQPTGAFDGQIWYDTGTGQTKQFKEGAWETITANTDPIKENVLKVIARQVDLAYQIDATAANFDDVITEAFTDLNGVESTSGDMNLKAGSDGQANILESSETTDPSSPDTTKSETNLTGLQVDPNKDLQRVEVTLNPSVSNVSRVAVVEKSSRNIIGETTGSFQGGDTVSIAAEMDSNSTYLVAADNQGSSYTRHYHTDSLSLPVSSTNHDITNGTFDAITGNEQAYWLTLESVKTYAAGSSGSITLTRRSLGFTPVNALPTQNGEIPNNTDLTMTISDNSGNSVIWDDSELGDEKSVPFSDGDIEIKIDQTNNGGGSPTTQDIGVMFGA
jgi:hypothetical protein